MFKSVSSKIQKSVFKVSAAILLVSFTSTASATWGHYSLSDLFKGYESKFSYYKKDKKPKEPVTPPAPEGPALSTVLGAHGFDTLLFALDTTGLTSVLDSNAVTVFAPTNDVFNATAEALGCSDALELATNLINIPVGDSNALATILTYHATLEVIKSDYRLLTAKSFSMVGGGDVKTGVNANGLYVQGASNAAASSISASAIKSPRWTVYPIDSILLPFDPPADLCGPV